jgi:ferredoxin
MTGTRSSHKITFVLPDGEKSVLISENVHIWDAATAAGLTLPALCHQGYCLTCAAKLEGAGEVDQSDSLTYFPQDRDAGFVLLCTAKPLSELRVQTNQQLAMREFRRKLNLPAPYY